MRNLLVEFVCCGPRSDITNPIATDPEERRGEGDVRMYLVLVRMSPRASTKYGRSSRKNLARSTMFSRESEEERTPPRSSDSRCRRNEERLVVFCGGCPIALGVSDISLVFWARHTPLGLIGSLSIP